MAGTRSKAFPTGLDDDAHRRRRRLTGYARLGGPLGFVLVAVVFLVTENHGNTPSGHPTAGAVTVVGVDDTTPVGTCFDTDPQNDQVFMIRDCAAVHSNEVVADVDAVVTSSTYPSGAAWQTLVVSTCTPAVAAWTGYRTPPTTLVVEGLFPEADPFSGGDRTITCFVHFLSPHAGSSKGLAQTKVTT